MEIVALLALVLGIIGAFKLLHVGMNKLDQYFDISGQLLPYVSFIVLFIVIIVLVNLLGRTVKRVLDMTLLGGFDRFAGALLGVLKWSFGMSLLLWLTVSFNVKLSEDVMESSVLYPYIETLAPTVIDLSANVLPFAGDLIKSIEEFLQGYKL